MLRWLYNVALLLFVFISLPKWLCEWVYHKKHRRSLLAKLGLKLPSFKQKRGVRIWVHSISVGETKAAIPFIEQLQQELPEASVILSVITETGYDQALSLNIDGLFYLPLDFSWTMRKLIKRIQPDLLLLVEGDFWFNLTTLAPHVALINGKISEKSLSRFKKVPFFSRSLFQKIELFCVQSNRFAARFVQLGVDPSLLVVTGNLKCDMPPPSLIDPARLGITSTDRILTIGSTHDPEETLLLDALLPLFQKFPNLKILIVPRHPERFSHVASLLKKKDIAFDLYSSQTHNSRILLVDTMGILGSCYRLSELAIVGGSFVPHIGGHNIVEPTALGTPVLFGPFMEAQQDLVQLVTEAGSGQQVSLETLASTVQKLLSHPKPPLHQQPHGSIQCTLQAILQKALGIKS